MLKTIPAAVTAAALLVAAPALAQTADSPTAPPAVARYPGGNALNLGCQDGATIFAPHLVQRHPVPPVRGELGTRREREADARAEACGVCPPARERIGGVWGRLEPGHITP